MHKFLVLTGLVLLFPLLAMADETVPWIPSYGLTETVLSCPTPTFQSNGLNERDFYISMTRDKWNFTSLKNDFLSWNETRDYMSSKVEGKGPYAPEIFFIAEKYLKNVQWKRGIRFEHEPYGVPQTYHGCTVKIVIASVNGQTIGDLDLLEKLSYLDQMLLDTRSFEYYGAMCPLFSKHCLTKDGEVASSFSLKEYVETTGNLRNSTLGYFVYDNYLFYAGSTGCTWFNYNQPIKCGLFLADLSKTPILKGLPPFVFDPEVDPHGRTLRDVIFGRNGEIEMATYIFDQETEVLENVKSRKTGVYVGRDRVPISQYRCQKPYQRMTTINFRYDGSLQVTCEQ